MFPSRKPVNRFRKPGLMHRRYASVQSFNQDGLEIARVKTVRRGLPLHNYAAFVYLVLVIRVFAIAEAGPASYANRIAEMREGTFLERGTAIVMQPDPVSQKLAVNIRRSLREMLGNQGPFGANSSELPKKSV